MILSFFRLLLLALLATCCLTKVTKYDIESIFTGQTAPTIYLNAATTTKNEIQETMDFLKSGDERVEIDDNYRDVVMMLGNTGTGKSAVTRFVAGDLADLESVEVGEFLIKYRKPNVIGEDTTVSQTIYPELVVDETNVAYYDCPGYDDTRNTSIEIAGTYFVKRVIDHAASVKLILVANYDSVRPGGHRTDFANLVEHIHQFVKNVTLYKDSIALIATKVENQHAQVNGKDTIKPDEFMIQNIVRFLTQYRDLLQKGNVTPLTTNALALVNVLLTTSDDNATYTKIGLFRKPEKAGFLSDDEIMVEGRRRLRKMIASRIDYTPKLDESFGYTLSDTAKNKIIELAAEINTGITQSMNSIGQEVHDGFVGRTEQLDNLVTLFEYFQQGHTLLTAITYEGTNLTADLLVERLVLVSKVLGVRISHENLNAISNQEMYIRFLQSFADADEKVPVNPNDWVTGLKDCIVYLEDNKNWYKFLSEIYEEYSQYEFRKELTKYNVANINDWGQEGKPQGILINSNNFWTFVQKQKNAALVKDQRPDEFRLKTLNGLLAITLRETQTVDCADTDRTLLVKGGYVRLDAVNMKQCGDNLQKINIMALHTVFIDSNIDGFGKRLDVTIMAPKWYIYGDRTFNLSGTDNGKVPDNVADNSRRANVTGEPGKPGSPGGNAGNFIGLAFTILNGENLQISAVGGKGSRGQDGGKGFNATDADLSGLVFANKGTDNGATELDKMTFRYRTNTATVYDSKWQIGTTKTWDTDYVIHSMCGQSSGGNGGRGGFGGRAGLINIFQLNANSSIAQTAAKGADGEPGIGGSNGLPPHVINVHHSKWTYTYETSSTRIEWRKVVGELDTTCPALPKSGNGTNVKDIVQQAAPSLLQPAFPISEFLGYIRENQMNSLRRDDMTKFVRQIQNSSAILNSYTTLGFINEMQTLEDQFFRLKHKVDLKPYYRSISDRVELYVSQLKSSLATPEVKKVFTYLYTAAWGKYLTLNSAAQANLVIKIEKYLGSAIANIQNVVKSERSEAIFNTTKAYKEATEQKINEANAFIKTDILPAINNITIKIDDSLLGIVDEAVALRKKAEADAKKYAEQLKHLQSTMALRGVFHVLGVVGTFANCLGPYGMAAGAITGAVSKIGEGFTDAKNTGATGLIELPAGLKVAVDGLDAAAKESRKKATEDLDEQLKEVAEKVEKHPETLSDTLNRIRHYRTLLTKENGRELPDMTAVNDIKGKVSELLKNQEKILNEKKKELTEDGKNALELMGKVNKGYKVFENLPDLYKKFKDDNEKLDEASKALNLAEKQINQTKAFEKQINDVMWPMVDAMRQAIADAENGLAEKSAAGLDLKKWQMQTVIRDTKSMMQNYTKGFTRQEDLLHNIQKLDEAFTTLLNIYDRIDSYHDQQKLGDFISDIATDGRKAITVNDHELAAALLHLDVAINSNVLLSQYKTATDGLEQSVFPFVGRYLDKYQLPPSLKVGNDTTQLIGVAIEQLEGIRNKIIEDDSSIHENDEIRVRTKFDSRVNKSRPFYVWPSTDYNHTIHRLLSGEKVALRADITSGLPLNAIKFNIAELYVQAVDTDRQAALNELLLDYDVKMTHMGNSYYRCDASFYVINSPSQAIGYSFARDGDAPLRPNGVYDKLKAGDYVLSPYAMWTIQMEKVSTDPSDSSFQQLKQFASRVNLVLVGRGQFVRNNVQVCTNSLEKYYRSETTLSDIALNAA